MQTRNYRLFERNTEINLFDVVEPRHPTAGALSFEDVQRRVMAQVTEMKLDEKLKVGREVASKHFATGKEKVSMAFNSLWAEVEARREAQRLKGLNAAPAPQSDLSQRADATPTSSENAIPVLSTASANLSIAGAYLSSWSSWASDKRKKGGWMMKSNSNLRGSVDADARIKHDGAGNAGDGGTSPTRRLRGEKSTVLWDSGHTSPKKEEKGRDGIGRLDA